jgi:phage baseplate assembly protein W
VSGYAWLVDTSPVPVPTTAAEEQQEQILGKGIFFDGDYRVTPHGDYLTIEQEEALKQDVYHRLITNPGEYKFRPDYGCGVRAAVNGRMGQAEIDALTNRIRENLLQDPRVTGVSVTLSAIDEGVSIALAIVAKGKTVNASFDVAGGP